MTGKEKLAEYCQTHSGEEIYDLIYQLKLKSRAWTDSRGYLIDLLDNEYNEDFKVVKMD